MRIIEVTGIAGVGKSYIINIISKNKNLVLDTHLIEKYHLNDIKLTICFFKNKNSLLILKYIFKISFLLNRNIFHKFNFIRNSIKKVGKNYFLKNKLQDHEKKIILIDEGIIHLYQNVIPYKQNNKKIILNLINEIVTLSHFSNRIILIDSADTIIEER